MMSTRDTTSRKREDQEKKQLSTFRFDIVKCVFIWLPYLLDKKLLHTYMYIVLKPSSRSAANIDGRFESIILLGAPSCQEDLGARAGFTVAATCATAGITSDRGDSREFRRQAISH